jgi:serine/threonine protein kinase
VVKDFINEVEILVKLRHPNIVQFLAAVITKPPLMLVTEYLPGGDLHALIQRGPVPADLAVAFALDMARGMAYLHGEPNVIIHRDLKPRNLIIDESNELKVGDFGLSKLVKRADVHEVYKMTGETGSYRYMAPEVFEHQNYNTKVDVFSFAMILYEMFEGAAPFASQDAYEAAVMVARENRRPEFGAKTHYPEGVREVITKCWSEFAVKRPPFDDIVLELEEIQEKTVKEDRHCFRHLLERIHRHRE